MKRAQKRKITVALAGNPNVGKSTLFNVLTGLNQHTGNWPGKTVGIAEGRRKEKDREFVFIDLPGTYDLDGTSEDEVIAAEYIRNGEADCIAVVCDGSCLERNLILTLQILKQGRPTVVCVNLMDEASAQGIRVDAEALSDALGVPVVLASAGRKQGIEALLEAITATAGKLPGIRKTEDPIKEAQMIAEACIVLENTQGQSWRHILDKVLVSRRHGISVMLLLLLLIVWLTVWGANYPSQLLERLFEAGYRALRPLAGYLPNWLGGMLLDGVYATGSRVISVMLPPMAIFFPLFTLLEDVGYLPRMAFLLDHGMCRCGGCGKQALTMCMGLGCNAVGVVGCRIIDSPRERLAAILTNAMVPCNGRFPTLIILGSVFFPGVGAAFVVAACVALGMAGAMAASGVLSKTWLKGESSTFLMEMPPFRRPRLGQILVRSLLDRTIKIALRALKVAAPMGALLWILGNTQMMTAFSAFLDPAGRVMGMNGIILLAFILSLPANELLIPVIMMTLTGAGSLVGVADVSGALLIGSGITWQMALCTMLFTLYHWPCTTTLLTIYRETGSMKKTAAAFFLPTAVGMLLCVIVHIVLG
jgi:ferrous iron transport protein B